MEKNPLLSIIVPNYNNEKYLRECLDSILGQTCQNIEIIVADDSSTDNSIKIIQEYEKKYPGKVVGVFHKKNHGVAYNRHSAILKAKGDYICTLDSDDYYADKQKLEKEMQLIEKFKTEQKKDIIAFSNVVLELGDGSKKIVGNADNIREGYILNCILTRSCFIPRDFIMLKRAYFDAGGYDFSFKIYEDWDLKIRLASKYNFYYTEVNGIIYRRHGKGLSYADYKKHINYLKKAFRKNIKLVEKKNRKTVKNEFKRMIQKRKNSNR